jgi:transposase
MSNIIGIDVSKLTLDCAYLRDADQNKPKRKRVANSPEGFESLLIWANTVSGLVTNEIKFIIEPSSIYHELIMQFLYQHQATIYLVNPARVRKFAQGMGILSKNDLIDADLLTRYGLMNRKLIAYKPMPQEVCELKSLLNRLDSLERDLRRELNKQEKIGKTSVLHPREKQSMQRFEKQLKTEIIRFKKYIRETIASSRRLKRDFDLLLSIPGIGAKTAWIMLVILSSREFKSAPEVASFLGLNPIEKESGSTRYRRPRLSKAGNARLRQSLFFPAMVASSKNPDIKAQYERLLAAGKTKMCALGAAMRKLVHICYGVLKNQRPYEVHAKQA